MEGTTQRPLATPVVDSEEEWLMANGEWLNGGGVLFFSFYYIYYYDNNYYYYLFGLALCATGIQVEILRI